MSRSNLGCGRCRSRLLGSKPPPWQQEGLLVSRGQLTRVNQTGLICVTAFSGVLAQTNMSVRQPSSGPRTSQRTGSNVGLGRPSDGGCDGERRLCLLAPPPPRPSVQPLLIYAAEMTFCFLFGCKFSSSSVFFSPAPSCTGTFRLRWP